MSAENWSGGCSNNENKLHNIWLLMRELDPALYIDIFRKRVFDHLENIIEHTPIQHLTPKLQD